MQPPSGLYVLANVGYLNTLGFPGLEHAPEDRVGTAAAARLNASGVPGVALALQAAWALVLVLLGIPVFFASRKGHVA